MASRAFSAPMNIVLLGDPAAGKGTQARFLVEKYGLYDLDMGLELNRQRLNDPLLNAKLERTIDKGMLAPTSVVRSIFRTAIEKVPADQGILFDGNPKMLGEARLVISLLKKHGRRTPVFIYLSIPLKETVSRIKLRKGYGEGRAGRRSDDTEAALKNRAKYYRTHIKEVAEYFQSFCPSYKISGMGSKTDVKKSISQIITKEEKQWQNSRKSHTK